jgi:hypothetical protein
MLVSVFGASVGALVDGGDVGELVGDSESTNGLLNASEPKFESSGKKESVVDLISSLYLHVRLLVVPAGQPRKQAGVNGAKSWDDGTTEGQQGASRRSHCTVPSAPSAIVDEQSLLAILPDM